MDSWPNCEGCDAQTPCSMDCDPRTTSRRAAPVVATIVPTRPKERLYTARELAAVAILDTPAMRWMRWGLALRWPSARML